MADHRTNNINEIEDLANPDWGDTKVRRRIAACLVNVVYHLEKEKKGEEMVKLWCKTLKFEVAETIKDRKKSNETIFGAVFKWVGSPPSNGIRGELTEGKPPEVVLAFRGTIPVYILGKDVSSIFNAIHARHRRIERGGIGLQYLQKSIDKHGAHKIWIAGHSLGAAIAMAAARKLDKEGRDKIETHLFNPAFFSPRLPELKFFEVVGNALAAVSDFWRSLKFGDPDLFHFSMVNDEKLRGLYEDFIGISGWIPNIYVTDKDPVSCSYIRYFEVMENLYNQGSQNLYERMKYVFCYEVAEDRTPWNLIPSAKLFVRNTSNHGIRQWWLESVQVDGKKYAPPVEAKGP